MNAAVSDDDSFPRPEIDLSEAGLSTARILEAAFEEAVTELALLTPEGRFLRAHAALCRLLGRAEADLTGVAVEDVAHPDDRRSLLAALEDARSGVLRGFRIWARALDSDGRAIPGAVAAGARAAAGHRLHLRPGGPPRPGEPGGPVVRLEPRGAAERADT